MARVERRGRLIEDEQLPRSHHCTRDRHDLALGERERPQRPSEIEAAEPEVLEHRRCLRVLRRGGHPPPKEAVDATEDVVAHAELGGDQRLLEDGGDAGRERGPRRAEGDRRSDPANVSRVRHQDPAEDLDQRRFSGAVLAGERVDLAATDRELGGGERARLAESVREAGDLDERPAGARLRRDRLRLRGVLGVHVRTSPRRAARARRQRRAG